MRQRIAGMCDIRDRARKLLAAQLDDVSASALMDLRRGLNGSYDSFRFVPRSPMRHWHIPRNGAGESTWTTWPHPGSSVDPQPLA